MTTCVEDVLPGCKTYRGDTDSPWGVWCEAAIAAFDRNRTAPRNVGVAAHPIYYFEAAKPTAYVLYIPASGALPIGSEYGRYEYFLFQYLKTRNVGVFVVQVPDQELDRWDHVPAHNSTASPYEYDCHKIHSQYDTSTCATFPCNMCVQVRQSMQKIWTVLQHNGPNHLDLRHICLCNTCACSRGPRS